MESEVSPNRHDKLRNATTVAVAASPTAPPPAITADDHHANGTHAPPFWSRHGRSESNVSYQSISHLRPPLIGLEDHSEEDDELGKACWAKHATVDDYVVITGATGIGAYVVWNCTIETIKGAPFMLRKRLVASTTRSLIRIYIYHVAVLTTNKIL